MSAAVFGIAALFLIFVGTWASISTLIEPDNVTPPILARTLFSIAGFVVGAAVTAFLRRDPEVDLKVKDVVRVLAAGAAVFGAILAGLTPMFALISITAVIVGTWVGVSPHSRWSKVIG